MLPKDLPQPEQIIRPMSPREWWAHILSKPAIAEAIKEGRTVEFISQGQDFIANDRGTTDTNTDEPIDLKQSGQ